MVPDHAYLEHEHRHVFHIRFGLTVHHQDREVEFLDVRDWLKKLPFLQDGVKLGQMSCEMIAQQIIEAARKRWDPGDNLPGVFMPDSAKRSYRCSVHEDGENGAEIVEEV